MKLLSLKEYAKLKNVTYEAVRKQVKRYEKELAGHLIQDGRQTFLDEFAVDFLDEKRAKNPVVIVQQDKDAKIEALEAQVKDLLIKVAQQADIISEWHQKQLETEKAKLVIDAVHSKQALRQKELDEREILLKEKEEKAAAEVAEAHRQVKILEGFVADAKAEIQVLTDEKAAEMQQAQDAIEQMRSEAFQRLQEAESAVARELEAQKRAEDSEAELAAYKALPWYKRIFK